MSIGNAAGGYQKEIDNNPQSQTNIFFQSFIQYVLKEDITLTSDALFNSKDINVSTGHGFVIGDLITIALGDFIHQSVVTAVNVDTISMVTPMVRTVPTTAVVVRGLKNLNLNGSLTETESCLRFFDISNAVTPIDLNYIVVSMIHSTAADDSLFGNIAAGNDWVYFRFNSDAITINLGFFNKNSDFFDRGAVVAYNDKAGGGKFSTRIFFDLTKVFVNEKRIDPGLNESLCFLSSKNLTSLDEFTISLIGSYTTGE